MGHEQKCTLRGHADSVCSVSYSPDGKHIVSGSRDDTVKIWDAQSGDDRTVKIWGARTGKEVRVVV